jgi:EmrB/QacA subfamily drug resistance transporter
VSHAATAPRADGYLLPRRQTLLAFAGVLLGMLLAALNQTIVATALPHIVSDLGGVEHYSWVFSAYMLAATVTVPLYGRLSDIHGRRPYFAAAIVIFMLGAVVGATAQSMTQLVLARAIQGLGAGGLIPLAMAVIGDLVPPAERGRWQGLTGAVFGLASVLGPVTGGWISDNADWRWVFLVSLPVGLVALAVVLATLRIPRHPERSTQIDWTGAGLMALGLSLALLGIVRGGQEAPWGSAQVVGLIAGGVVLLVAFVRHERRTEQPILPVSLFGNRTVAAASAAGFATGMAMFGSIMFVPLFVQGVLAGSATSSGLVLAPLMLAMILTSVGSGQVISRTGRYRWALVSGPAVMLAGFVLLAGLDETSSRGGAAVATIVLGLGLGLLMQNLVLVIQNSVPSRMLGVATSTGQLFRSVGGTVGVSVMGAILAAGLPAGAVAGGLTAAGATGASRAALADAMHPVFLIGAPVMAVALLIVLLIPEVPLRRTVRGDASNERAGDRSAVAA